MRAPSTTIVLAATTAALALGCAESSEDDAFEGLTLIHADASDLPLPGLDPDVRTRFDEGDTLFEAVFREGQGLGPLYIRQSCASCHADDARGPGSVLKMALVGQDGVPLEDQSPLPYGATIRPHMAGGATQAVTVPESQAGLMLTTRFGPAVFGRGAIEAILDSEIERVEAEQAAGIDGVTGRINRVTFGSEANPDRSFHSYEPGQAGLIGRFGLKARIATLDDFSADAFQGDMGITSPLRPEELPNPAGRDDARLGVDVDVETVNQVADYVRLLRIPARAAAGDDEHAAELFSEIGCDRCHVPSLRTRPDYPIAPLADTDAAVYSDLLLHDMGADFNDGLREHDAAGSEWRTAPLIGLRHLRNYLHDGRAKTIEDAIIAHGASDSEAATAVDRFQRLQTSDRDELLEFVSAL
jgi:CxxC motif-containing protein (DUF1111 family)